jgi:hypothetical protein
MATRLVFNSEGFRETLMSEGVHDLVEETANEICDRANVNNTRGGEGFTTSVIQGNYGGGRWIGFVKSTDKQSAIAESEDQALSGAVL